MSVPAGVFSVTLRAPVSLGGNWGALLPGVGVRTGLAETARALLPALS